MTKDIYRFLARSFTATGKSPEQIHEIGKAKVARILAEMEPVKDSLKFEGDLNAFNNFLRTDQQFYYDSPEALLEGYHAVSKRLDPELVKLFGKLPRTPYGVKPILSTRSIAISVGRDIRDFHDELLGAAAIPLDALVAVASIQ